jgi:rod shape-determining protein MreD
MSLTLAAVGAVVAALLELTVVPYLRIGGAEPDLVIVCAVVWTVVAGIEGGLIWAFIGGLMIDLLAPRPLGSTAFTLLICVGGAAVLGRALDRVRYIAPVIAVFVFAVVNSMLFLVVYGALRGPLPVADPIGEVLPDVIYTTVVAAIIGPLAVVVATRRRRGSDRIDW